MNFRSCATVNELARNNIFYSTRVRFGPYFITRRFTQRRKDDYTFWVQTTRTWVIAHSKTYGICANRTTLFGKKLFSGALKYSIFSRDSLSFPSFRWHKIFLYTPLLSFTLDVINWRGAISAIIYKHFVDWFCRHYNEQHSNRGQTEYPFGFFFNT